MRTRIVHPHCDKTMTRSECEVGYGAERLYAHLSCYTLWQGDAARSDVELLSRSCLKDGSSLPAHLIPPS